MAEFNPDAYLADENEGFDPDAYLASEEELPVKQRQGVDAKTRAVVNNLIEESPELQMEYLKRKGFDVKEGSDGQLQVKKPGDKSWSVVDPKGFEAQDILDHAADAIAVMADFAGLSLGNVLGSAAAGAATETVRQNLGKLVGAREEVDMDQIAKMGAAGLAGGIAGKAVGGLAKFAKKASIPAVRSAWGEGLKKAAKEVVDIPTKLPLVGGPIKQGYKAVGAAADVSHAGKMAHLGAVKNKATSIAERIEDATTIKEKSALRSQLSDLRKEAQEIQKSISPKKLKVEQEALAKAAAAERKALNAELGKAAKASKDQKIKESVESRLVAREARLKEAADATKPRSFAESIMETAEQAAQRKKLDQLLKGK